LTTLLRKAKERGGVISSQQYRNFKERDRKRQDTTPPLPPLARPSTGNVATVTRRQRSTTSASPSQPVSATLPKGLDEKKGDRILASPYPKESGTLKVSAMLLFLKKIEVNCYEAAKSFNALSLGEGDRYEHYKRTLGEWPFFFLSDVTFIVFHTHRGLPEVLTHPLHLHFLKLSYHQLPQCPSNTAHLLQRRLKLRTLLGYR